MMCKDQLASVEFLHSWSWNSRGSLSQVEAPAWWHGLWNKRPMSILHRPSPTPGNCSQCMWLAAGEIRVSQAASHLHLPSKLPGNYSIAMESLQPQNELCGESILHHWTLCFSELSLRAPEVDLLIVTFKCRLELHSLNIHYSSILFGLFAVLKCLLSCDAGPAQCMTDSN